MNLLPQFLYSHILEDPITTLESKIAKNKFQILQIQPNKYQEYYILQSQKKNVDLGIRKLGSELLIRHLSYSQPQFHHLKNGNPDMHLAELL